jgi:hypothetical protein
MGDPGDMAGRFMGGPSPASVGRLFKGEEGMSLGFSPD